MNSKLLKRGARTTAVVTAIALFVTGHIADAKADEPPVPEPAAIAEHISPLVGPSDDRSGIATAAGDFDASDAASTVALVEAVTAAESVPMEDEAQGLVHLGNDATGLVVEDGGAVTAVHADYPSVGFTVSGEPTDVTAFEGVMVLQDVEQDTDVVVRAVDGGTQLVAVLASAEASNEVSFELELPDEARLVEEADGSITVLAQVEQESFNLVELDAFDNQVAAILGAHDEAEVPTAAQMAQLEQLNHPEPVVSIVEGEIGMISAPWAVDATGQSLSTRYELQGSTLVQLIETSADTAFPVTADPGFWWYVRKAAECIAGIALFTVVAWKVAAAAAKIFRLLKASRPGTYLRRAYDAWLRLGSNNDQRIGNLTLNLRIIAGLYRQYGASKATSIIIGRGGRIKATRDAVVFGASTIATAMGVGSCISLVTGRNY